jgi:hypothetical protein
MYQLFHRLKHSDSEKVQNLIFEIETQRSKEHADVREVQNRRINKVTRDVVPWLRRLIVGLSPRKPRFDPGSVHVEFVVDKVALGQVFLRVLRFFPANFILPVLHYLEKTKKRRLFIFTIELHNKPQGCGASVASAAGSFTKKKFSRSLNLSPSRTTIFMSVHLTKYEPNNLPTYLTYPLT